MTVSNNKELLLEVNHLGVSFKIKNEKSLFFAKPQTLKAVKDVSFKLYAGETLGVVDLVAVNPHLHALLSV